MIDNESSRYRNFKNKLGEAILAAIDSCSCPMTSSELHKAIGPHMSRVAFGTVISTIYDLAADGLLTPIDSSDGPRRYQRIDQSLSPPSAPEPPRREGNPSQLLSLVPVQDEVTRPSIDANPRPPKITITDNLHQPSSAVPLHLPVTMSVGRTPHMQGGSNEFKRHLAIIRPALDAIREKRLPVPSHVALPPGMDRSILRNLPFRVRTWNCLNTAGLFEGNTAVTVGDLLRIRSFGRTSLRDLLLRLEEHLQTCILVPVSASEDISDNRPKPPNGRLGDDDPADYASDPDPLSRLLIAASALRGYTTMAELLAPDVLDLADRIGVSDELQQIHIQDVATPHLNHISVVLHEAEALYNELTTRQRAVLNWRFLESPRRSLKQIGSELGTSRQRIQQIGAKLQRDLKNGFGTEIGELVAFLRDDLGPIAFVDDVDRRLSELFADDGTCVAKIARYVVRDSMGYSWRTKGIYLNGDAYAEVESLKASVSRFSKDGIIDEIRLKDDVARRGWQNYWSLLLKCCAFHELFGLLCLRNSDRVRTKDALISIGAPATKEEISSVSGVAVSRVGAYLSGFSDVVRADKWRWGLSEWVDDEYEGIEAEIVQRITEGGGVTSTNRLIEELPRKFGVSVASVTAYLQRPVFSVRGNHVTLKDSSSRNMTGSEADGLRELPRDWKVQARLRCGSICGLGLSPRLMKELVDLRNTSLLELFFFLRYGLVDRGLSIAIRTDADREIARDAYVQFQELLLNCHRDGRALSGRIEWIIPSDYSNQPQEIDGRLVGLVASHFGRAFGQDIWEEMQKQVWEWLPWMPLSVIRHLRMWRGPKINTLRRAVFKLSGDVEYIEDAFYPWDPTLAQAIRLIPIQALYQYEPSSATLAAIHALRDCNLISINDLRCLHPDAVAAAKHQDQPLLQIYRDCHAIGELRARES